MNKHEIKIERCAHYYSLGEIGKQTTEIWLVCHGYGQLAKFFIEKFKAIERPDRYILAPEGLNKFYLKGYKGRVGASWMTKENRNDEINDYCQFLDKLISKIKKQAHKDCKIHVMGFSQGAATVSRWILRNNVEVTKMILWGGYIASDFDFEKYSQLNKKTKNFMVFGTKDEFYSKESLFLYKKSMIDFDAEWITYDGRHTITPMVMKKIADTTT